MKIPRTISQKFIKKYLENKQYSFLSSHSVQVCKIAIEIFKHTKFLHNLGKKEKKLLAYGALLHDIGYIKDAIRHNKYSRDIILNIKIPDCSKTEQKMIACIARYHRGAYPSPTHKVYRDLNENERRIVDMLSAILRIADGLDYTHQGSVRAMNGKFDKSTNSVVLEVEFKRGTYYTVDLERAKSKADLFSHVFRIPVVIKQK